MKKTLILFILFLLFSFLYAQHSEDFETGDFSSLDWQMDGYEDWLVTSYQPFEGNFCAQTGYLYDGLTSSLSISMETSYTADISFYWKSSLQFDDKLIFYIDGLEIDFISYVNSWQFFSVSVESGEHTFKWTFEKGVTGSTGLDFGWIDNITFPPTTTFDNDLAVKTIYGQTIVYIGDSAAYDVVIKNWGNLEQDNYIIRLFGENNIEYESLTITENLESEAEAIHKIVWLVPDNGMIQTYLWAEVEFPEDEDPSNNSSGIFPIHILSSGQNPVTVGYGNVLTQWYPMNFYFENSLSETIYYSAELGYAGEITAISYKNNFNSNLTDIHTKLWIGNTNQSNLTNGWINASSLTPVFDDYIDYPSGINDILITLDSPFSYSGGNLVLMCNRPWDDNTYTTNDEFYSTINTTYYDRTRAVNSHTTINPVNPPTGYLFSRLPNTTFYITVNNTGFIEGIVSDNFGNPLIGADVILEQSQIQKFSNSSGYYLFGNIIEGLYSFTASAHGFNSVTEQATIYIDQTTELNFDLYAIPTISVSGQVVGSDEQAIGIENCNVILTGYENYSTVTDANGDFLFPDIYVNNDYTLNINHPDYSIYSDEIIVQIFNLDLGVIIINEKSFAPAMVQAVLSVSQTEAEICWFAPPFIEFLRDFESYNTYRFLEINNNEPENWDLLSTEIIDTFYIDTSWNFLPLEVYQFAVTSIHTNGVESIPAFSNILEKTLTNAESELPDNGFKLLQNYPNPFNPTTTICFELNTENTEITELIIYNIKGQKIKTFPINASILIHINTIIWDGTDDNNQPVTSGIYFYKLKTDNFEKTRKMILMK